MNFVEQELGLVPGEPVVRPLVALAEELVEVALDVDRTVDVPLHERGHGNAVRSLERPRQRGVTHLDTVDGGQGNLLETARDREVGLQWEGSPYHAAAAPVRIRVSGASLE